MADVKLGIVRLGRVAGKTKYTILDEVDITMVESYCFEPRLNIDQDGNGAKIYAYAYSAKQGRPHSKCVQDMIWEKHKGRIPVGFCVVHKNGITVDNRLDNLQLKTEQEAFKGSVSRTETTGDPTLYYLAIQQLPGDPIDEQFPELNVTRFYDANGEVVEDGNDSQTFYECHFPPCCNIEKEIREFSVCGHCQLVRYCGQTCQQKDWLAHKKLCRPKRRNPRSVCETPER